ncbi:hypothetical protein [Rhodococcus sp. KRD162]|nr:hypothetical protein [Rhodococcus sp. KRD162]
MAETAAEQVALAENTVEEVRTHKPANGDCELTQLLLVITTALP